ncbi:MAG: hypothetical protein IAF08_09140, partial [Rhizobacter sp.]|nr:hypothetical protein [Chlorobiales bacterium]
MSEKTEEAQAHAVQCLTTEHFTLQTARSAAIMESNGRASLFLSTVSSAFVAMAFIGQMSELGEAFFAFCLVLFPTLYFLGVATFVRVLQTGIEDMIYARGINRIRHFYTEVAPEIKKYLMLSVHDDMAGALKSVGITPSHFQTVLTSSGMIAVINSVLAGVCIGILLNGTLRVKLWLAVIAAVVAFLISSVVHYRYQARKWAEVEANSEVLFPS